jgi:Peptidase A4 family
MAGSMSGRPPTRRSIFAVVSLAAAAVLASVFGGTTAHAGGLAFAALRSADSTSSANWAGYVVTQSGTTYTSVTATWKEPKVSCGATDAGESSAFWVGLGGSSQTSQALEQVGTSADCKATTGSPSYYAWYELVPANSVTTKLVVHPGDTITTSVNVLGGTTIELQLKNRTRHTSFTTKLPYAAPDLTSAEWIAEAPSACDDYRCSQVPLSNFGTVSFTNIAAIGNSVGGTLTANPGWTNTAISLVPDGNGPGYFPGPDRFAGRVSSTAGAVPGAASSDGRSFAVQYTANAGTGA